MNKQLNERMSQSVTKQLPRINAPHFELQAYLLSHWRALLISLRRMMLMPLESLTILAVIGIALALPAGLFVLLQNAQQLSQTWGEETKLSLFLKTTVSEGQATQLTERLRLDNAVAQLEYVSPQQGLAKLSKQIGFSQATEQLPTNPLPGLIEVIPTKTAQTPAILEALVAKWQQIPEVDLVQLDMDWVKRLQSILKLSQKAAYALAVFFACAVFLIIGNTIHLAIQSQRREIEVIKLVGGTHAFTRRPFLYRGVIYGLLGALFAALLIGLGLFWLSDTVAELAVQYNSHYALAGLGWSGLAWLLLAGAGLGLSGAWLAVNHYLRLAN